MFLKDNKILWKRIAIGAGVLALLSLLGIFWLDIPLYKFLRGFDCGLWHVFDFAAGFQAWVAMTIIALVASYLYCGAMCKALIWNNNCSVGTHRQKYAHIAEKVFNTAIAILLALFIAAIAAWLMKIGFGRMRPLFFDALSIKGFYPFAFNWAFHSFPSGHAAACFAGLVTIGLMFPRAKPYTWAAAIIFGISRISIGMHWPSDVLFGAFIGMASADLSFALLEFLKNKGYNLQHEKKAA
jgi:membrane-associated phospholipid phosphatase